MFAHQIHMIMSFFVPCSCPLGLGPLLSEIGGPVIPGQVTQFARFPLGFCPETKPSSSS